MNYEDLPEAIRLCVPYPAWLWLSDAEKERLLQTETEPDPE